MNKVLDKLFHEFFTSALDRSEKGKKTVFNFIITADELKRRTGKERLHCAIIVDVIAYFRSRNVVIEWLGNCKRFKISVDLITAVQNVQQAEMMSKSWRAT